MLIMPYSMIARYSHYTSLLGGVIIQIVIGSICLTTKRFKINPLILCQNNKIYKNILKLKNPS